MKHYITVLTLILSIACALFWKQIWALFHGMTALESMEVIVNFLLHAAVATILGYAAMVLPEFIKPWLKTFRWKQRAVRRGRAREIAPAPAAPARMTHKDQALLWLVQQMSKGSPVVSKTKRVETKEEDPGIRLNF